MIISIAEEEFKFLSEKTPNPSSHRFIKEREETQVLPVDCSG